MDGGSSAPVYKISSREVVAVEHPMIVKNIEKGLKTFGNGKPFTRILDMDDPEGCIPLYLRQNDPMCIPILSHNSPTNNVLLKITLPKRIGKRKRGSQEPYSEMVPVSQPIALDGSTQTDNVSSHSRNDGAAQLLRALKDNVGKYQVEVVAEIKRTHRFRGITDFHHSTTHNEFSTKFQEFVLPGEVEKMRQFQFDPSRGWKQNEEFLPPPAYTHQSLPFNWGWHQNPHISTNINEATGEAVLTNKSKTRRFRVQYVTPDTKSVPSVSPFRLPEDPAILEVISKLAEVLNERPVWTRRAIGNRIGHEPLPVPISKALHHVAYQFKGGPFRDAIIKYGVDPRTNKQYRNYQTVLFKLYEADEKGTFKPWTDVRKGIPLNKNVVRRDTSSHIFDGKTLALDGKIWQLCDITDPLLCHLIRNATLRKEYEATTDGYFSNGAWAKIHAIMRTKLIAIRAHIEISDSDFKDAMNLPDVIEDNNKESYKITVPVPDIRKVEIDSQITGSGGDANFMGKNAIRRRNRRVLNVKMSQKLGIEKGTGTVMVKKKSKYLSEKPLQRPKSCEADDAEVMLNEGRERQKGEGMVPSQGPTVGARATLHQEGQPNSPSDVYQTAKENIEVAADDLEDDDNDEGESEDDDSEEDDLEDSESQDEDDLGDEGGEIGSEQDEEDYDGETTDIVHPTT